MQSWDVVCSTCAHGSWVANASNVPSSGSAVGRYPQHHLATLAADITQRRVGALSASSCDHWTDAACVHLLCDQTRLRSLSHVAGCPLTSAALHAQFVRPISPWSHAWGLMGRCRWIGSYRACSKQQWAVVGSGFTCPVLKARSRSCCTGNS